MASRLSKPITISREHLASRNAEVVEQLAEILESGLVE